ncbi:MAG: outer membrane lipoprotein LolB [Gammaproteobacteria bacterium]|jgi:outer membrane lipoprotein LolB|nr:outer membrane lipoprotein LolB [Gammaproteobacteria bacterium]
MQSSLARLVFLSTAVLVLLAGCATTPESIDLPDIDSWDTRTDVLGSIENWEFKGRIAVKAGDDGFNGKFNWAQQDSDFSATVGGPLGMGTVRIEGDGQLITLTDNDGVETVLHDPEVELRWRYGWTIPVTSLRYWALGIPDPATPSTTRLDEQGLLSRLEQSGWVVEISKYHEGGGQQMPRVLTATNPDTRVRMVIDRWLFLDR